MHLLLFNLATDLDDPILGFTTAWITALARRMEFIHVITMRAGRVEVPDNVRVYSVGKEKGYSEARRLLEFYRYLFRILRVDCIDVCFSHMIPTFTVLAAPILKARHIPIVTWYAHRHVSAMLKVAHHLSDQIVSSADSAYHYKRDKLEVIGQGIDTDLFSPDGTEPEDPPLLLCVGRLSPIKDQMTLIEAVHILRQRGYPVSCALVGDAPQAHHSYVEELRRRVEDLKLAGVVQFVGSVPNHEVVSWYRRCFAHVNCSPADHSLDKAVLEAMACGKPSFTSTLGFQNTVGQWEDMLLFHQGNPEDLAARLERLLCLGNRQRQAMAIELRQSVMRLHSLENLVDKMIMVFQKVQSYR
ncbi:Glycosyl transferase, family 1 [Moorella glycerini]|uniref:GDP-mannose-dependent alpha-(1-6)-phosphatidylinositol monomannoside mannosyltransferase n=1 Tax=Neomoorella stamsii TaxID=1266720 RepID=A0A9X7J6H0_9FIRM|nr:MULTISPECIES: glycosyltransferase family 4 protein [Moorella]PRR77048.1 GDP-mannose-dependent alpha-(1-6)-phosphatidylinositol monomannoside mannosyltransferase [Moorella stamsii]CEP68823.1 Glycosyl transferase, family 1 [Moorella glycerini]